MELKSYLGHRAREVFVYWNHSPVKAHRVLFFVDGPGGGMSSGLRGYEVADSLNTKGWNAAVVPAQLELVQRRRIVSWFKPDVLYLQSIRNKYNRVELYPNIPVVFDLDDADYLDENRVDVIHNCARQASAVIAGSHPVVDYLSQFSDNVNVIWTGAKPIDIPVRTEHAGTPTLVWACSTPDGYHIEGDLIREVLLQLKQSGRPFKYQVIGKAERQWLDVYFKPLLDAGIACEHLGFMPYHDLIHHLATCDIGLAPLCPEQNPYSSGKSFGKILAYLNARMPVVTSDAADHRMAFQHGGGILCNDPQQWLDALQRLIDDRAYLADLGNQARDMFETHLSVDVAADKVSKVLAKLLRASP